MSQRSFIMRGGEYWRPFAGVNGEAVNNLWTPHRALAAEFGTKSGARKSLPKIRRLADSNDHIVIVGLSELKARDGR